MKELKSRAETIAVIIGVVLLLAYVLAPMFTDMGDTTAALPGAVDAWGFQWAAQNVGGLLIACIFIIFVAGVFWTVYSRRRKN